MRPLYLIDFPHCMRARRQACSSRSRARLCIESPEIGETQVMGAPVSPDQLPRALFPGVEPGPRRASAA
jgi:hypothetical protein